MLQYRFEHEHPIWEAVNLPHKTELAISAHIGLPHSGWTTLEDLTLRSREEIVAIKGVGPKAIHKLDQAMAAHGLAYYGAA